MRYLLYRRKSRYIFFYQKYRLLLWRTINIYTYERLCFHKKGLYCRLKVKIIVSSFYWKKWWEEMDSNHRSETQRIYSPPLLATQEPSHKMAGVGGFEPPKCRSQSPVPYRLATPQYYKTHKIVALPTKQFVKMVDKIGLEPMIYNYV